MQQYPQSVERLLKRKPIKIDTTRTEAAIAGKTVLVTGAGGSIGSALCRRIREYAPGRLVLLDKSEHGLYQVGLDLEDAGAPGAAAPKQAEQRTAVVTGEVSLILGDLCDSGLLARLFDTQRPDIVFHAAAYKHVPLLEYQPHAAIRNNVLGTYRLVDTALKHRVPRLVMLSTDKAVKPASIMGASKRIAELIVLGMSTAECKLTAVRLGNVLGSQGSVLPRFAGQIAKGKPLTVTHPNASRYFLTAAEAADLVLAAAWLGQGADILVPDIGEPVRIVDLAREMIAASGPYADEGPGIVFTGLGPGEKLSEELLGRGEPALTINGSDIKRVVDGTRLVSEIEHYIAALDELSRGNDTGALIGTVREIVPEYQPSGQVAAVPDSPGGFRA